MFRNLNHILLRTLARPFLFQILPHQKSSMYLAFGSLISYGNVHLTRFFADKSEKPKRLKELCKPSLFKIGPKKFIFHLHEDLFDKSTLICISQLNRMSQMPQDVWISIPAVKILVKKLVEVGEVVEKIDGDALKRMWPDKVLFEYGFLDCQRTCEITLKLLRARNDWFGKFDLEITCEHLLDESNRSMILVPSNVIHLFQDKLTEILNKYVKLQEPNRPQAFRLLCEKSFVFETKRYCLYLNQGVKEICIFLNEFSPRSGIKSGMIIPISAAELMLPLLRQAYKVISQNEGRFPTRIKPFINIFQQSFIVDDQEFTVEVSQAEFRKFGDMILRIKNQNIENKNKKNFLVIRSHGVPVFLKHFEEILQEFEKLKLGTVKIDEGPKPKPITIKDQLEQKAKIKLETERVKEEARVELKEFEKNWKGSTEEFYETQLRIKEKHGNRIRVIFETYNYGY